MDQSEQYPRLQTATQLNKYQEFLKKTLQIVVPVSLLLFLFSYSLGFSIFFQYFDYQFSSLLFPLFTQTLERKYIFLICNGILAFLIKNSGFSALQDGASPTKSNGEFAKSDEHGVKPVPQLDQHSEVGMEENHVSEKQENGCLNTESEEREGGGLTTESEENEAVDINTEELNRKFDEFIRKMKEEIRIEAQRPLIAV